MLIIFYCLDNKSEISSSSKYRISKAADYSLVDNEKLSKCKRYLRLDFQKILSKNSRTPRLIALLRKKHGISGFSQ